MRKKSTTDNEIAVDEQNKNQVMEYLNYIVAKQDVLVSAINSEIMDIIKIHNFIDLLLFVKLKVLYKKINDYSKFLFFIESEFLITHENAILLTNNIKDINIDELNFLELYNKTKGFVNLFSDLQINQQLEFSINDEKLSELRMVNNKLMQLLINTKIDLDILSPDKKQQENTEILDESDNKDKSEKIDNSNESKKEVSVKNKRDKGVIKDKKKIKPTKKVSAKKPKTK